MRSAFLRFHFHFDRLGERLVVRIVVLIGHRARRLGPDRELGPQTVAELDRLAAFDLDGRRTNEKSMSPRDMDTLEVEIRNQNEVWVKFQHFQKGIPAKIAQA